MPNPPVAPEPGAVEPIRIAMWSGPRNISTGMMRAFENRPDTAVIDEPFYAAFLAATGIEHPMRDAVLAAQPTDWRIVAAALLGTVPGGRAIYYQKHMTHHMLEGFGCDWMASCRNAFLIRAPEFVLASYTRKRETVNAADLGFERQRFLFDRECQRLGAAPPVIDAASVLASPSRALSALCRALGIPFTERMLSWPPGRRDSDGVWAPAWYDAVERSTGFTPQSAAPPPLLGPDLQRIADAVRPHYDHLAAYELAM
jgi:hypothetical protein